MLLSPPRIPRTCVWEITNACNLRCVHCESGSGRAAPNELTTEEGLALLRELKSAGCKTVSLTGGEPLLRKDWPLFGKTISQLGMTVHLVTNGVLLDEKCLEQAINAGVTGIAVSLDGNKEIHDAMCRPSTRSATSRYDAALSAIHRVAQSPLKAGVITMVHKKNLHQLEELHDLLSEIGIDTWQVQMAMPIGRMASVKEEYMLVPRDIPELEAVLGTLIERGSLPIRVADNIGYFGRHEPTIRSIPGLGKAVWQGCSAGCLGVAICADGSVKGCPSHPRELIAGNLRKETFRTIWNDSNRFSYNTKWDEQSVTGGCARCPFKKLCRAGCTTMALASTGTFYDNLYCLKRAHTEKVKG